MQLHPKQSEFLESTKRYKLLNWGRRSGKTYAVGYEIFITLWNKDGALVSYYAPTRDDARSIAWESFKELLGDITLKTNESLLEVETKNKYGTKSTLRLAGWEAVKNRDKGRGVENDLVVLDECAFFPMFTEKFSKVIEPTLLTSKGRLIITSTPNGFNHFYNLAQTAQADPEWFYSHATSYDNPHNDPEELRKLKEKKTDDSFAQEYLADFRKVEGLVYQDFNRELHIATSLPANIIDTAVGKRGCIDFGFRNPAAIYTVYKDSDSHYWVTDEYQETEKVESELIEVMKMRHLDSWYPDPEDASKVEMMRRSGLVLNEVDKSVNAGINTVKQLLRQKRVTFVNCPTLEFEFDFYRWQESISSNINKHEPEKPVKEHDHGLDAVRYLLHSWEMLDSSGTDLRKYYANIQASASKQGGLRA